MTAAGYAAFYDRSLKVAVSGPDRQVSWASQAWLTLGGVLQKQEAAEAPAAPGSARNGDPSLAWIDAPIRVGSEFRIQTVAERVPEDGRRSRVAWAGFAASAIFLLRFRLGFQLALLAGEPLVEGHASFGSPLRFVGPLAGRSDL